MLTWCILFVSVVLRQCMSALYKNVDLNSSKNAPKNIDIISPRKPLRRLLDFILYNNDNSNPKFIIEKMVDPKNSQGKSILFFRNIEDVKEEQEEKKKNDKRDHKKTFLKLFYGYMFERCLHDETKNEAISVVDWIEQQNKDLNATQRNKALTVLSFSPDREKNNEKENEVNVLVLNEIDGILSDDKEKRNLDWHCELKSRTNREANDFLDFYAQAKVCVVIMSLYCLRRYCNLRIVEKFHKCKYKHITYLYNTINLC